MKYAIVESGGKQYKAVEGGTIQVDRLPVEVGENIKFEQVLLLVDGDAITVGTPLVKDTPVWATVVEHFLGDKVTIFNYRPKKRIRVKTGHRQGYSRLLIEQIGGATLVKKVEPVEAAPVEAPKPAKKPAKVEDQETKKPVKKAAEKPTPAKKPASSPKKPATKTAPAKTTKTTKTPARKSGSK